MNKTAFAFEDIFSECVEHMITGQQPSEKEIGYRAEYVAQLATPRNVSDAVAELSKAELAITWPEEVNPYELADEATEELINLYTFKSLTDLNRSILGKTLFKVIRELVKRRELAAQMFTIKQKMKQNKEQEHLQSANLLELQASESEPIKRAARSLVKQIF